MSTHFDLIHVTGTKGKGSTCSHTESLVRCHSLRQAKPLKTGLYTTPHLLTERERIRINSLPLSEEMFARYFFDVWERLLEKQAGDLAKMPRTLQLRALLSVHIFMVEKVDLAIYEVHVGGKNDATNIFTNTMACGFSTIGIDHLPLLGDGIPSIALH